MAFTSSSRIRERSEHAKRSGSDADQCKVSSLGHPSQPHRRRSAEASFGGWGPAAERLLEGAGRGAAGRGAAQGRGGGGRVGGGGRGAGRTEGGGGGGAGGGGGCAAKPP